MLLHGELPAKLYPPPHSVPRTTWGVLELWNLAFCLACEPSLLLTSCATVLWNSFILYSEGKRFFAGSDSFPDGSVIGMPDRPLAVRYAPDDKR